MKKKRSKRRNTMPEPTPPSKRIQWSAESMASTMMEVHPKLKRIRDEIADSVKRAAKAAAQKVISGRIE